MIFFVANDGTVISSVPSPVYQGSVNANNIYLVAPFAANLQVTVAFKLPNGVWTGRYLMTQVNEIKGVINENTGKPYVGWQFSMTNEITQYYGTVTAQFYFYAGQGTVITASSATSFTVGQGVPEILPPKPTEDIYNQIIDNLSVLSQQLNNGTFAARSIYAWNSQYTYGASELVFYPDKGEYGVFLKSLKDSNNAPPYKDGVLDGNWQLISDFNILTELYTLKSDMQAAVQETQAQAAAAAQSAESALNSENSAELSATNAEKAAQRVEAAAEYLEGVQAGMVVVPKAAADGKGNNIANQFAEINGKIPSAASKENQLADKAFVNSSINNMAAFYITYNAQGDAFATHASLINATTFYSGGQERTPTQNDYATVLADETQPKGVDGSYPTTRYVYQTAAAGGTYPNGQWEFQYVVNNTSLTQAQVDAINSGITKELVDIIGKGNVLSVNGKTGAVTITSADIGAVNKSGDTMTGELSAPIFNGTNEVQENNKRVYSPNNPQPPLLSNTDIPDRANLNDYITPGVYTSVSASNSLVNLPPMASSGGKLIVYTTTNSNSYVNQEWQAVASNNRWIRSSNADSGTRIWSLWQKYIGNSSKLSTKQIGSYYSNSYGEIDANSGNLNNFVSEGKLFLITDSSEIPYIGVCKNVGEDAADWRIYTALKNSNCYIYDIIIE